MHAPHAQSILSLSPIPSSSLIPCLPAAGPTQYSQVTRNVQQNLPKRLSELQFYQRFHYNSEICKQFFSKLVKKIKKIKKHFNAVLHINNIIVLGVIKLFKGYWLTNPKRFIFGGFNYVDKPRILADYFRVQHVKLVFHLCWPFLLGDDQYVIK